MTDSTSWDGQSQPDPGPPDPGPPDPGPPDSTQPGYGPPTSSSPPTGYGQPPSYGQPAEYGQPPNYGQQGGYGQYGQQGGWNAASAPAPGGIPLRPLALADILTGSFTSIRRNPRATLGFSAILLAASGLMSTLLLLGIRRVVGNTTGGLSISARQPAHVQLSHLGNLWLSLLGAGLLSIVLNLVVEIILTGMLTAVIGHGVLGRTVSIGEAWRVTAPRLLPILGMTLLGAIIVAALWLPYAGLVILLIVVRSPLLAAIIGVLGFPVMLCVTFAAWVTLSLAPAAVVLERQGPWRGLVRSRQLVRDSFWRMLGILILALIIIVIASLVLSIPFMIIEHAAGGGGFGTIAVNAPVASVIVAAVGGIVVGAITRPLLAGVSVLLYLDMRMRKEGLDLVLQNAAQDQQLTGDEFATLWQPRAAGRGTASAPTAW